MNIKNRIKTIERKMNIQSAGFCACYGTKAKSEVMPITIDEWKRRFDDGEERYVKLPDVCDRCRKPIDKRFIETTFEQTIITEARIKQASETIEKFAD